MPSDEKSSPSLYDLLNEEQVAKFEDLEIEMEFALREVGDGQTAELGGRIERMANRMAEADYSAAANALIEQLTAQRAQLLSKEGNVREIESLSVSIGLLEVAHSISNLNALKEADA